MDAIEQTARFVQKVRQEFPDLLVGDIEPYPAVPSADHVRWLDAINARLRELGVHPLDFYRVDPDWAAFPKSGNWSGVKSIADAADERHIPFSLIYWAAKAPQDRQSGHLTERSWGDGLLAEAEAFRAVGGKVDQIVINSWIALPTQPLPEADPSSFAGAALALLNDFRQR